MPKCSVWTISRVLLRLCAPADYVIRLLDLFLILLFYVCVCIFVSFCVCICFLFTCTLCTILIINIYHFLLVVFSNNLALLLTMWSKLYEISSSCAMTIIVYIRLMFIFKMATLRFYCLAGPVRPIC